MSIEFFLKNKYIKLAIALKANQLKREELSSLTYEHVESTLYGLVWSYRKPCNIHAAVNDILNLNANEVVQYLSSQAIITGSQMNLNEFDDLIGGLKG